MWARGVFFQPGSRSAGFLVGSRGRLRPVPHDETVEASGPFLVGRPSAVRAKGDGRSLGQVPRFASPDTASCGVRDSAGGAADGIPWPPPLPRQRPRDSVAQGRALLSNTVCLLRRAPPEPAATHLRTRHRGAPAHRQGGR